MRFTLLLLFIWCICPKRVDAQLIPISTARALPLGSTVTVNGTATSGSEFGTIRYMQDGTGGIAVFSSALAIVQRGDNITVTGITIEFQNLLEISPVDSWTLNSSGNPVPSPVTLSPSQMGESNESMLVRVNNVTFLTGGNFQGNTTYSYTSNGEAGTIFIRSGSPLVGQPIPTSNVIVYGINSQYGNQFQLMPRDMNDIVFSSVIAITTPPYPESITSTGFDVKWNTDMPGNAFLRFGLTPALELGVISGPVNSSSPTINISGASDATVYYLQAFSVSGTDTAFSSVRPFITASNSTGDIKVYFNREVNNAVAIPSGNNAVHLPNAFADTIKAYMDRCVNTLDIAIYSFSNSGTSLITQGINDAWSRGVRVRVIAEGDNTNNGLPTLNPAIPVLFSPTSSPFYYGIMHNKFIIIDAEDSNPDKPVVMTGSTNWSNNQINSDRNNLVFVQDQALARVYQMEFEEMWGGNGNLPDVLNSKFGPDKTDNTPHVLNVGGKKVESYFSPSDNTNNQIGRVMGSAHHEVYFATMVFTRFDLAYVMEERVINHGVYGAGIVNDSSGGSGVSFQIMAGVIGNNMRLYDHPSQTGILHHKYLIVDQAFNGSEPLVLTGSHNWSSAATQRNDENTLIIYDQQIANQYYQEFHHLFNSNGGALGIQDTEGTLGAMNVYPNPSNGSFYLSFNSTGGNPLPIVISDVTGRVVHQSTIGNMADLNEVKINKPELSKGVYFLTLGDSSARNIFKLIIQ